MRFTPSRGSFINSRCTSVTLEQYSRLTARSPDLCQGAGSDVSHETHQIGLKGYAPILTPATMASQAGGWCRRGCHSPPYSTANQAMVWFEMGTQEWPGNETSSPQIDSASYQSLRSAVEISCYVI